MKRIACCIALASALIAPAGAASLDSYVGQQPESLLKSKPDFAKAYRSAIGNLDLPAWTARLAAGKFAEIVTIDGSRYLLTSACSSKGCLDERIYVLFDPQSQRASGIFFLPPANDDPGDMRTAFSRWYGLPADASKAKPVSTFLLERAMDDAQSLANPPQN
ncbi:Ivy family c-type lysozyme inhibitor [Accumulibacter sp.]|uniref:Ivy family c-type lysozyme inhibitor n=1 Tax=Accumulibacter sp. TaxID=2053492 RepID=UPI0028C39EAB|nr:Ivy family c-type lysozyme inhibitor [Accumulibacter sp.]